MDKLFLFPIFRINLAFQSYFYSIQELKHDIITQLDRISAISLEKTTENDRFKVFLNHAIIPELDQKVQRLNNLISPLIDCQQCGNCCKTLMIVVTNEEANKVSNALNTSRETFDQAYLEKGGADLMLMNSMPCAFLKENSCTIYKNRFEGCKEFPALDLPDFKKRLFSHFMHYSRCPIIFNVVEQLKIDLNFELKESPND